MSQPPEPPTSASDEGSSEKSWVPKLHMVFESDEKAYQFYCFYAREIGFGVRKHLVKRRSNGTVYARTFCCYKEGFCRSLKEGKKPRPDARTGCGAHIGVRLMDDGKFHVTEFEAEHNHVLVEKTPEVQLESTNDLAMNPNIPKRNFGGKLMVMPVLKSYIPSNFPNNSTLLENVDNEDWVPKVDMEFEDDDEAYEFYINYAARIGFSVRKHLVKRRSSGLVYSRTYVCHKEGRTRISNEIKREQQHVRGPKPYERTGCAASMTIKIMKNGRYRVTEFELKHNHPLVIPSKAHLFRWRWRRGLVGAQADSIALANGQRNALESSDIKNGAHESNQNPTFTSCGYNIYSPSKHLNELLPGDLGAVMQYVQEKQAEDPSFYYALKLDQNEKFSSIFWSDGKSMFDFECFGDVVCLDTTYRSREYGRPLAPFVGVNNHKQIIVFGIALLYNESKETFEWLFKTFKTAMSEKQPNVVLTDRCEAMSNAIAVAWPGTNHRICVWHMYNNALKHLNFVFQGSTTFAKDFSRCMYDVEDEDDFVSEWTSLVEKYDLGGNLWLTKLYEEREKWSVAYGRHMFYADIKSSLLRESISAKLKDHLHLDCKLLDFFERYENELNERRNVELQADFRAFHSYGKMLASKMLRQASNAYTPAVFKVFQMEFELSMDLLVFNCDHVHATYIYKVKAENCSKEYIVRFNTADNSIICSCRKFDFMGIQCKHVLKVLDIINIKELPPQYILKRWTKDAKTLNFKSLPEIEAGNENKSELGKRCSSLRYFCNRVATRAAETEESYEFFRTLSNELMEEVCKILKRTPPQRPRDA
ncbi:protein FAR1-RELATED SEQUENCE 5-like [Phalaenopsis equestris]|uniref:protein FAR1-RELATED SEQUENCE 5-like n=1 Tax=Phalaenopsis equestris TaxID=78828 RepID=UPI0009E36AA4|nr:protein FAR1-RELATED SEQUENCE 5-like [Phalaenopsis equestris]XP_020573596.1 protein FAR1-RELATED SEQUENCE 5-like [Phalaenopsis equestris]XP_020573597.1 protein FAR1-RELATED SEQUENCE 5-like [Phalaenopsis equestris]XP_020573598.1 protein FAR1-RELATED SEQUENCE 5-like [Phalaenopsis equestris]XP_020573599.1 protein FAR1-RELATED SEQUENCE 5-like [Phalaenopsis equestris]